MPIFHEKSEPYLQGMKPVYTAVFSVPASFYSAFTALIPYITQTFVRGLRTL
jgi:hypothetical protein